jgi:hypothetical protein
VNEPRSITVSSPLRPVPPFSAIGPPNILPLASPSVKDFSVKARLPLPRSSGGRRSSRTKVFPAKR